MEEIAEGESWDTLLAGTEEGRPTSVLNLMYKGFKVGNVEILQSSLPQDDTLTCHPECNEAE